MGHQFVHRLSALFAASFSVCALGLLAVAGVTESFLKVEADEGSFLYIPDSSPHFHTMTHIGVLTGNALYDNVLQKSLMYLLSQISLFAGIAFGSFTVVLSLALSSFLGPTNTNWKLLGVFAAITAILQIPVFLIFDVDPCTSFGTQQSCNLSNGSWFLISSTVCWVVVTLATQFLEPPRWADEMNAWRTKPHQAATTAGEGQVLSAHAAPAAFPTNAGDGESQAPLLIEIPGKQKNRKAGILNEIQRWMGERNCAASVELPRNQTDSLTQADEQGALNNQIVPYHFTDDHRSPFALNIGTNVGGQHDANDVKNIDGDDLQLMAEEGRLPATTSQLAPPSRNASFATNEDDSMLHSIDTQQDNDTERAVLASNALAPFSRNTSIVPNEDDSILCCSLDTQRDIVTERAIILFDNTQRAYADLECRVTSNTSSDKPKDEAIDNARNAPEVTRDSTQNASEKEGVKRTTVIKNLTENLKKRSRVKKSKKKKYTALMDDDDDDDDMEPPLPMQEVFVQTNANGELPDVPDVPGTPTRQAEFPCFDPRALSVLRQNRRRIKNEGFPDPVISYSMESDDSTSEDVPDPVIAYMSSNSVSTSEDEPEALITSTFSASFEDIMDGDFDSAASESSSESSSSEEYQRIMAARTRRRQIRGGSRGYSSVRSVVSSGSLLDTFIPEETDADLKSDEESPYELVRSRSAPASSFRPVGTRVHRNHQSLYSEDHASVSTVSTHLFRSTNSNSGIDPPSKMEGLQCAPVIPPARPPKNPAETGSSNTDRKADALSFAILPDPPLDLSLYSEEEDPVASISFSSERSECFTTPAKSKPVNDPPDSRLGQLPSTEVDATPNEDPASTSSNAKDSSTSFSGETAGKLGTPSSIVGDGETKKIDSCKALTKDRKEGPTSKLIIYQDQWSLPLSPALTEPMTPSPMHSSPSNSFHSEQESAPQDLSNSFESERSWKIEREMRCGIHMAPFDDESSGSEDEMSKSTRSCDILRAARIRRIRREQEMQRTRSRTQDPVPRWRRSSPSGLGSVVDKLDLQLIEVMRPVGDEYGPEEKSL